MEQAIHLALPQFQKLVILMVRIGGILSAWPVLRSRTVPMPLKAALTVGIGFLLLPIIDLPGMPDDPWTMAVGLSAEFLLGMILGIGVRFVFEGINMAGELMGMQMGLGSVQLIDPTASNQVPLVSNFMTILASLVFLSVNGHLLVVHAIADSFSLIPPFGARMSAGLIDDILQLSQGMFVIALKIAAPVMATVLLINLGMAILGRAVPQMNVFVLSFPVTIAGGLLMTGIALPFVLDLVESEFTRMQDYVVGLMQALNVPR